MHTWKNKVGKLQEPKQNTSQSLANGLTLRGHSLRLALHSKRCLVGAVVVVLFVDWRGTRGNHEESARRNLCLLSHDLGSTALGRGWHDGWPTADEPRAACRRG